VIVESNETAVAPVPQSHDVSWPRSRPLFQRAWNVPIAVEFAPGSPTVRIVMSPMMQNWPFVSDAVIVCAADEPSDGDVFAFPSRGVIVRLPDVATEVKMPERTNAVRLRREDAVDRQRRIDRDVRRRDQALLRR
jgi:hypothetical protein